jgi:hypothetical protein
VTCIDRIKPVYRQRYSHAIGKGVANSDLIFCSGDGFHIALASRVVFFQRPSIDQYLKLKASVDIHRAPIVRDALSGSGLSPRV